MKLYQVILITAWVGSILARPIYDQPQRSPETTVPESIMDEDELESKRQQECGKCIDGCKRLGWQANINSGQCPNECTNIWRQSITGREREGQVLMPNDILEEAQKLECKESDSKEYARKPTVKKETPKNQSQRNRIVFTPPSLGRNFNSRIALPSPASAVSTVGNALSNLPWGASLLGIGKAVTSVNAYGY